MKKYINGKYIEMTVEEIAEFHAETERMIEEIKNLSPTPEERLEALESAMLAMLGGVL